MRQHILTDFKQKFKTVDEAEDALGLPLEAYLDDTKTQMTKSTKTWNDLKPPKPIYNHLQYETKRKLCNSHMYHNFCLSMQNIKCT